MWRTTERLLGVLVFMASAGLSSAQADPLPQERKQGTIPTLESVRQQYPSIAQKVGQAIEKIQESLLDERDRDDCEPEEGDDPEVGRSLFLTGDIIDPERGEQVFNREKDAVEKMDDLVKKQSTPAAAKPILQGVINALVEADRGIARKSIDDAQAFLGDQAASNPDLQQAEARYAQAQGLVQQGKAEQAIEKFKEAWQAAQEVAVPHLALKYAKDLEKLLCHANQLMDRIEQDPGNRDHKLRALANFITRRTEHIQERLNTRAERLSDRLGVPLVDVLRRVQEIVRLVGGEALETSLASTVARLQDLATSTQNPEIAAALAQAAAAIAQNAGPVADRTPPVIANLQPANGSFVASATPTTSATFSDNLSGVDVSRVMVSLDGADITAQTQVTARGFSFTPAQPLTEGQHMVAVSIADRGGNTASATSTFTVDTTLPTITDLAPPDGGFSNARRPQVSATLADTGSGVDTSRVTLTLGGNDVTTQATVTATSIIFAPSADLAEGPHTVAISVGDRAGNTSTASGTWTLDFSLPQVAVAEPADGSTINTATPTMRITYSDALSGIDTGSLVIMLDGVDVTPRFTRAGTEATYTPAMQDALSEGAHTLTARILDRAGNEAAAQSSFTVQTQQVDTTPPVTSIVFPRVAPPFFYQITAFEGTQWRVVADARDPGPAASGIKKVEFLVDGVPVSTDETAPYEALVSFPSGIAGQTRTLTTIAEDNAGNRTTSAGVVVRFITRPATGAIAFRVSGAPATIQAGQPFPGPITIEAIDANGQVDSNYTGTVRFFTSDWRSIINYGPDYYSGVTAALYPENRGVIQVDVSQLLQGEPPLFTAGQQVIAVADIYNPARDQGVMSVTVTPGPPAIFSVMGLSQDFSILDQPSQPLVARVTDAFGNGVPGLTMRLETYQDGQLTQTLDAVDNGSGASFPLQAIDRNTLLLRYRVMAPAIPGFESVNERVAQVLSFRAQIVDPPDPPFLRAGDPFVIRFTALDETGRPIQENHPEVVPLVRLSGGDEGTTPPDAFPGSLYNVFQTGVPMGPDGILERSAFMARANVSLVYGHRSTFSLVITSGEPHPVTSTVIVTVIPGISERIYTAPSSPYLATYDRFGNTTYGAELIARIFKNGEMVGTIPFYNTTTFPNFFRYMTFLGGNGTMTVDVALANNPGVTAPFQSIPITIHGTRSTAPSLMIYHPGSTGSLPSVDISVPTNWGIVLVPFMVENIYSDYAFSWVGPPSIEALSPGATVNPGGIDPSNPSHYIFSVTSDDPSGWVSVRISGGGFLIPQRAPGGTVLLGVNQALFGNVHHEAIVGAVQRIGFSISELATPDFGADSQRFINFFVPGDGLPVGGSYTINPTFSAHVTTTEDAAGGSVSAQIRSIAKDGTVLYDGSTTLIRSFPSHYVSAPFLAASRDLAAAIGESQFSSDVPADHVVPVDPGGHVEITTPFGPGRMDIVGADLEIERPGQGYAPGPFGIFKTTQPQLRYTILGVESFEVVSIDSSSVAIRRPDEQVFYVYLLGIGNLSTLSSQGRLTVAGNQILVQPDDLGVGVKTLDTYVFAPVLGSGVFGKVPIPIVLYADDAVDPQSGEVIVEGGWVQEAFDSEDRVQSLRAPGDSGEPEDQWLLERRLRLFFKTDDPSTPANEAVSDEHISSILRAERLEPKGLDRDRGLLSVRSRRSLRGDALVAARDNPPGQPYVERAEFVHSIQFVRPRINGDGVEVTNPAGLKVKDLVERIVPVDPAIVSAAVRRDEQGQEIGSVEFLNPYRLRVAFDESLSDGRTDTIQVTLTRNDTGVATAGALVETAPDSRAFEGTVQGGSVRVVVRAGTFVPSALDGIFVDLVSGAFGIPFQGTKLLVESTSNSMLFKEEAGALRVTAGGPISPSTVDSIELQVTRFEGQQDIVVLTETSADSQVFTGAGAQAVLYDIGGLYDPANAPVRTNPTGRDAFLVMVTDPALGIVDEPFAVTETQPQSLVFQNNPTPNQSVVNSPEAGESPPLSLLEANLREAQQFFVRAVEPGSSYLGSVVLQGVDETGDVTSEISASMMQLGDYNSRLFESQKPVLALVEEPDSLFRSRYEADFTFIGASDVQATKGSERRKKLEAKIVSLGDSVTAGMNSLTLRKDLQNDAYPDNLGYRMGSRPKFPIYPYPGRPVSLWQISTENISMEFSSLSPLIPIAAKPTNRSNPGETLQNLGVPGALIRNVLEAPAVPSSAFPRPEDPGYDPSVDFLPFFSEILGAQKSAILQAIDQKPSLATIWLGNNDALLSLIFTDASHLTAVANFRNSLRDILTQIRTQSPGTDILIVNVPDATQIPFFLPAGRTIRDPDTGARTLPFRITAGLSFGGFVPFPLLLTDYVEDSVVTIAGVAPSDQLNYRYSLLHFQDALKAKIFIDGEGINYLLKRDHADLSIEQSPTKLGPTALQTVRDRIQSNNPTAPGFNEATSAVVQEINATFNQLDPKPNPILLVDAHAIFEDIRVNGRFLGAFEGGKRIRGDYRGGLFSLDGVHPSITGQAVVTDEIVRRVRRAIEEGELPSGAETFGGFPLRRWRKNVYSASEYNRVLRDDPRNRNR